MEKEILGTNKKPALYNVFISTIFGLIGGIIGSVIFLYFGIVINPGDFYYILPLAIILSLIHPRFMCFSYAGGIISLISLIFKWPQINVAEIMFVVGVLHLIESFLILVDGINSKIPIFMEREREIVGGFTMNRFWPVPFNIFIHSGHIYPITIMAILGYSDFALSNYPKRKATESAIILSLFSIILLFLSWLSTDYQFFKYVAAFFAPLAHETIIHIGRRKEDKGNYIFASTEHGLKVLDVLPESIGEKISLNPGDIILSLNGHRVYSKRDIDYVLRFRPSYIWLDIYNKTRGVVFKEYRDYEKGIGSLGVVVVSNTPEHVLIVEESKPPIRRLLERFMRKKSSFKN